MNQNITDMLTLGKETGLTTLSDSYNNYVKHESFASLENPNAIKTFVDELAASGLCEVDGIKYTLKPYTIEQCEMLITLEQAFSHKGGWVVLNSIRETEVRLKSNILDLLTRWLDEEQSINSMLNKLGTSRRTFDRLIEHFNLNSRVEFVKKANQKKRSKFNI